MASLEDILTADAEWSVLLLTVLSSDAPSLFLIDVETTNIDVYDEMK